MDLQAELANRERGQIPISIGTSLALEGAAGILEEAPVTPAPLLSVREVWINLRTLFRNLHGCLEKNVRDYVTPEYLLTALLEELDIIKAAIVEISGNRSRPVFYYSSYKSLRRNFPKAFLKEPVTDLQKVYAFLEQKTIEGLISHVQASGMDEYEIKLFDVLIEGSHPKSFIITHLPVDLLSIKRFDDLLLLESHTGAIKTKHQWNSKLTNGKELTKVPFNRMTLQIFGDGGNHFSPMPIKIRRRLLEIADKYQWTVVTTVDKIIYSIRQSKEGELEKLALELLVLK